jgi:hypothetical protein
MDNRIIKADLNPDDFTAPLDSEMLPGITIQEYYDSIEQCMAIGDAKGVMLLCQARIKYCEEQGMFEKEETKPDPEYDKIINDIRELLS